MRASLTAVAHHLQTPRTDHHDECAPVLPQTQRLPWRRRAPADKADGVRIAGEEPGSDAGVRSMMGRSCRTYPVVRRRQVVVSDTRTLAAIEERAVDRSTYGLACDAMKT